MKNEEIVRWYIEKSLLEHLEFVDEELKNRTIDLVLQYPEQNPKTLLRALELAVGDVG